MKTHKKTHMYNACTFALSAPTKLISFRGVGGEVILPKTAKPKQTPEQKEKAELKTQLEKTRKQFLLDINTIKQSASFKELAKLDAKEAKSIARDIKGDMFKDANGKELNSLFKGIVETKLPGSTLTSRYKRAVHYARGMMIKWRKEIKKRVIEIKKQRKKGLEDRLGKAPHYKKSAKKFVDAFMEKFLKTSKLSEKKEEQIKKFGLAVYAKQAAKFSKVVFYDAKAFEDLHAGVKLKEDSKAFKDFNAEVTTLMTDAVKRIKENEEEFEQEGDLDAKVGASFFLPGSATLSPAAANSISQWFDTNVLEKRLLKPGKTLFLKIAVFSSPEGSVTGNKELRRKRFEAQKRAILLHLRYKGGPNWRKKLGNVKFYMESQAAEPELKLKDFPGKLQAKLEKDFQGSKFGKLKKRLGGAKTFKEALAKIAKFKGTAEARLHMMIKLLGGGAPKKVLTEYNNYMRIRVKQGDLTAEKWLTSYSKYLIKIPHLLKFLNKEVGLQRSAALSIAKENPWVKETIAAVNKLFDKGEKPAGYKKFKGGDPNLLTGSNRPDVKVYIDSKTATTTIEIAGGGKAVFVAGTKGLVPKIRGFIAYRNRMTAQKITKGLKQIRARIAARGNYKLDYSYMDEDDHTPFSKQLEVKNKDGNLIGTVEPDILGNNYEFKKPGKPPKVLANLTVARATGQVLDEVFA